MRNGAGDPIARNVRQWRIARELTLSGLAARAGVAKSTVSLIERGQGNPSIDTIRALAAALELPFVSLLHDDPPAGELRVVRAGETTPVPIAGDGDGRDARLMLTRPGGALMELYSVELEEGAVRDSRATADGLLAHVLLAAGSVELSIGSDREVIGEGDLISFRADQPHSYRVLEGPARLVVVHDYPRRADA